MSVLYVCISIPALVIGSLAVSPLDFPGGASGKEPTYQSGRCKRHSFDPWVWKIPWRRAWQPTPVFLPGECHGQGNLVGFHPQGPKESDTTEVTSCMHARPPQSSIATPYSNGERVWGQRGRQGPGDAPEELSFDLMGSRLSVWHPGGGGLRWAAARRAREEERGWRNHPLIESGGVQTLLRRQGTRILGRRLWGAQPVQRDRGRRRGQRRRKRRRWVLRKPREKHLQATLMTRGLLKRDQGHWGSALGTPEVSASETRAGKARNQITMG